LPSLLRRAFDKLPDAAGRRYFRATPPYADDAFAAAAAAAD